MFRRWLATRNGSFLGSTSVGRTKRVSERASVLESLLEHPGWREFQAHVAREWSAAACWHKVKETGGDIERVNYTNTQVGQLMNWPVQEIARERRADAELALKAESNPSRRGVL